MRRVLLGVTVLLAAVVVAPSAEAAPVVPSQWISKSFTESVGRLPTQAEWQADVDWFTANGCSRETLAQRSRERYLAPEFLSLPYQPEQRLLAAYRGILNDEPDRASFDARLQSGEPWAALVDDLLADARFADLVPAICGENPSYSFGGTPSLRMPVRSAGFPGGTSVELQAVLDQTPPGGTVWLAQGAVVSVTKPLVIPANVTLATTGLPSPHSYARMARVVRMLPAVAAGQPVIEVMAGGDLLNLWVDGQRGARKNRSATGQQIMVYPGVGSRIEHNVISNAAGPTALGTLGGADTCRDQVVRGNLVTLYSTHHHDEAAWADGITIGCDEALVEDNEVVDATDVAIIVFTVAPSRQRSVVRNNRVLQAGNSAYVALMTSEGYKTASTYGPDPDFTGTRFEDNLFWTSDRTHYDFGILVGVRALYAADAQIGRGAAFVRNGTGTQRIRANNGIIVNGHFNTVVQDNAVTTELVRTTTLCPMVDVSAAVSAGWATGAIQPYEDLDIAGCLAGGRDEHHVDRFGFNMTDGMPGPPSPATATEEAAHRPAPVDGPVRTLPATEPGWRSAAGTIATGNQAVSVTTLDFQAGGCEPAPRTQGLDGWVFDARPEATAMRIRLNGATGAEVAVASFWSSGCVYLGYAPTFGTAIDDPPPAGTAFIVVRLASGARANVLAEWLPPSA